MIDMEGLQKEITAIIYTQYEEDMRKAINGKIEDKDIWIISNTITNTLKILKSKRLLKEQKCIKE